jgi:hypothetical protein
VRGLALQLETITNRVQLPEQQLQADRRFQILTQDQQLEEVLQHDQQQHGLQLERPGQIRRHDQHGHRLVLVHLHEHDLDQLQVAPEAVAAAVVLEEEIKALISDKTNLL